MSYTQSLALSLGKVSASRRLLTFLTIVFDRVSVMRSMKSNDRSV